MSKWNLKKPQGVVKTFEYIFQWVKVAKNFHILPNGKKTLARMSRPETVSVPILTTDLAKEILNKTLDELQVPGNVQKLDEARDNVGNEMLKMMQFLFPIVMQIQMDVIKEFGYPEGREGIIKFSQTLRGLEREDSEIARLHGLVKAYYLPPVSVHTSNESPAEERTTSS